MNDIPNDFYLFVGGSSNGRKICTGGQKIWAAYTHRQVEAFSPSFPSSMPEVAHIEVEHYEAVPFQAGNIKTFIYVPTTTQGEKGEYALIALINGYSRRRERQW